MSRKKILCLFDVDGTLTYPRKEITSEMKDFLLNEVSPRVEVALVGGSDYKKVSEQMGGFSVLSKIPFIFSENGLVAHKNGVEYSRRSIQEHMGEEALQKFINFSLGYMSKLILPVKRGTFIEFRTGLINVSPIGRGCSQKERDEFEQYDNVHKIREKFIEALKNEFPNLGLVYSIGGQISFDVFPLGWDKTYSLTHIKPEDYEEIHFFGDKTYKGGNDYEIFSSPLVKGHTVKSPVDTMSQLKTLLSLSTALHWAACRGNTEAVATLVRNGADKNSLTNKGETPYDLASCDEIQLQLEGKTCTKNEESLPITPNYLRNPQFLYSSIKSSETKFVG